MGWTAGAASRCSIEQHSFIFFAPWFHSLLEQWRGTSPHRTPGPLRHYCIQEFSWFVGFVFFLRLPSSKLYQPDRMTSPDHLSPISLASLPTATGVVAASTQALWSEVPIMTPSGARQYIVGGARPAGSFKVFVGQLPKPLATEACVTLLSICLPAEHLRLYEFVAHGNSATFYVDSELVYHTIAELNDEVIFMASGLQNPGVPSCFQAQSEATRDALRHRAGLPPSPSGFPKNPVQIHPGRVES